MKETKHKIKTVKNCYFSKIWTRFKQKPTRLTQNIVQYHPIKVILCSYLLLKKMNERITDSQYINKYTS